MVKLININLKLSAFVPQIGQVSKASGKDEVCTCTIVFPRTYINNMLNKAVICKINLSCEPDSLSLSRIKLLLLR